MATSAPPRDALGTAAARILETCELALAHVDRKPDWAYLSPGLPAIDRIGLGGECESMLVVYCSGITTPPTEPGGAPVNVSQARFAVLNRVTFGVLHARCIESWDGGVNGAPPDDDDVTRDAQTVMTDIWLLFHALRWAQRRGELFDKCAGYEILGAAPLSTQGGVAGWLLTLTVDLYGFDPYST